MINVTVWNEFRHEKSPNIAKVYPKGIHGAIAEMLGKDEEYNITTATLDDKDLGLSDDVLNSTDVLIWWGHMAHNEVPDELADKIVNRVLGGMGFIALHSAHRSKPFVKLMGTSCRLRWRENDEKERLWVIDHTHPITKNLPEYIELLQEETYGESFDIPTPDELVFVSWFEGGEIFRSGCCFKRGKGRIFYFRPGHEEYPTFYRDDIMQVIKNAIHWANSSGGPDPTYGHCEPLESVKDKFAGMNEEERKHLYIKGGNMKW